MISYAQNFEDVMLWRALKHVEKGNYIDIGAQDPLIDSVSLAFHELGWRGIHIEPTPHYAELLRQQRPGDSVIQAAVGNGPAVLRFFEIPDTGISTADPAIAQQHRERGFDVQEITVPCIALSAIFDTCTETDIHWLKIDVEGYEKQVLTSWGKSRARPWIVVVESTLPLTQIETHETWESILTSYDYSPIYFDGLNRYYISNSHPELQSSFQMPPNVFDGFSLNGTASNPIHHLIADRHKQQISEIVAQNEEQELSFKKEIDRLNQSLMELSQTHAEQQHASELHKAEITAQLHAIQQQAEAEKIELSQLHHTQLQEIQYQHAEHERLTGERIHQLNHALQQSQTDSVAREQLHAENVATLQVELSNLLRAQVQREQEFNAQLHAIQQQAEAEKTELSQQYQTQLQEIQRQHAEHEWLTGERIHQLNHALQQSQTDSVAREQLHAENVATLQVELSNLLRAQVQREQEFNAQLHAIQQQATAEKTELSQRHHHLQLQHIQQQQASESVQQKLNSELLAQQEVGLLALAKVSKLEQQLADLRLWEKQLNTNLAQQAEHAETLAQHLTDIQSTWLWRVFTLFHPARWPNITAINKIDCTNLPSMRDTATTNNHHQTATTQYCIDEDAPFAHNATTPQPTREFSDMLPPQHIYELFIFDEREFITVAYRTLLGREPDPNGMNYYLGRLRMGYGKASIIVQLANSSEAVPQCKIKGLSKLIKEEQQANHWFWGLFSRHQRTERIIQKNVEEIGRLMSSITLLKSAIQTLPSVIDEHAQRIQGSLKQLALQTTDEIPNHIAIDHSKNMTSEYTEEPEELKHLTLRARNIYWRLKKSVQQTQRVS
ncbi:MAG: FkbM family methyltransferase [Burkholderiales bacterium]